MSLPEGPLVAWLGDDFTGAAAVAETLAFAGLPAILFTEPPDVKMLARFPGLRGIGLATTARAETPAWMDRHLPPLYAALKATGAPLLHYKACSTMDSAPQTGSLGRAMELGLAATGETCAPILLAAPAMGRWQAFGTLFATAQGATHRIDRHPVMGRHPVTPMDEADVARHLARQTALPLAPLMRPDLSTEAFDRLAAAGAKGIPLDCTGEDDLARAGAIIAGRRFAMGSQGVEMALLARWRSLGWLAPAAPLPAPSRVTQIAVVSGSASPTTARQIAHAERLGWPVIRLDTPALFGPDPEAPVQAALQAARAVLAHRENPIVAALRGPDDPALALTRAAVASANLSPADGEARIGEALGRILAQLDAPRLVVAGGDTSGRVTAALKIDAFEPLAWIDHGASLMRGHRPDAPPVEIVLKGGQMGADDLFPRCLG